MISIIVPIYNAEKYLDKCIKSILDSTYTGFELILVNDGSEDKSSEICKKYLKKDLRIKYYEQKNKGVSTARNKGIEECHGEWVVFIDSDDFISCDFLDTVAKKEYQHYDFLIFDYIQFKNDTIKPSTFQCLGTHSYEKEELFILTEKTISAGQLVKDGSTKLLSSWAKAYKRSIINQYSIHFPVDIAIGEDTLFNLEYLQKIKSCVYMQKKVYFYQLRPNSAVHGFSTKYLQNNVKYQKQLITILDQTDVSSKIKKEYCNSVLFHISDMLIKGIFNPYSTRTYRENCELCHRIHENDIYMNALKFNSKMGRLPRKILLFFFRIKCYRLVALICKFTYKLLEKSERFNYV